MRHIFNSIRNPKLETWTGANKSSIKPLLSCTRTSFFVLQRTLGLARWSKASLCDRNIALIFFGSGGKWTWIWTSAWISGGVAVFKRNWRWWAGRSANSWRKPRFSLTTRNIATKWISDYSLQSFIEARGGKKKETSRGRIENNKNEEEEEENN